MKTVIEGIEITPQMINALEHWYDVLPADKCWPATYVEWLNDIQDCLTRIMIYGDSPDEKTIKRCLSAIICIKDDLVQFIPQSKDKK
jgi:hypothetical protein